MILPLVVFDVTPKLQGDPAHALSIRDILDWEKIHGRVPAGCFAALRTDMSRDWETDPQRFKREQFPAWSLEAIQFLYERRGIVANGHESMDTDTSPDMKSETWLLHHGHWQIEVMSGLDQVPATGALLVVAWPKPKEALGFRCEPLRSFRDGEDMGGHRSGGVRRRNEMVFSQHRRGHVSDRQASAI